MNKNIKIGLLVVMVGLFVICSSNILSNRTMPQSNLLKANIEAIANEESGQEEVCYNTITSKLGSKVRYCPICDYIEGTDTWYSSPSKCPPSKP